MSQVQEIKEKLDLVEFVGERLSLQRSGKNFRGLCPFHSEKSPSFFVSPDLQSFICFGCGKKGDIFTFVQEFDRLTFREALEMLAEKSGVELVQEVADPQEQQRKTLLEILHLSQQYFAYLLNEHSAGEPGRQYLRERGTTSSSLRNFGLGYAPDGWDNLYTYLTQKKKFHPDDVLASGLVIQSQNGKIYDRFRDRLMFPLHDHRGRVVGFSGRILKKDVKEAKYVNTPETAVYHKRYLLYGYHQNLDAIREKEAVIIMEGEFDVISSTQAHVKNVVAVKGSALTVEQIRLLSRTAKTLYLALDADSAGIAATVRAIELVQPFPVSLRVIPITGGKDPDELSRSNPGAWRELTDQHVSAFEYVMETTAAAQDLKTPEGQKELTNVMLRLLLTIDHAVERTFYLKQLAEKLDVAVSVLEEQLETMKKKRQVKRELPAHALEAAKEHPGTNGDDKLGQYILQLLLRLEEPSAEIRHSLTPELFAEPGHQRLMEAYVTWWQEHDAFLLKSFAAHLPAELQGLATNLYLAELPLEENQLTSELAVAVTQLRQRSRKVHLEKTADDYEKLSQKPDPTPEDEQELARLAAELRRLTQTK